jgi:hypothetical protein
MEGLVMAPKPLTFFGHTHLQGGFLFRNSKVSPISPRYTNSNEICTTSLKIDPGARYLINPGSVGQPRDRDARAAFAILDTKQSLVEFWRVPYDIGSVQERLLHAGLPKSLAARLASGH